MNVNFPDAVVVLAYFCENDGPRVVMTTQAVPRFTDAPAISSTSSRRTNLPWDIIAEKEADAPYTINVLSLMECNKPFNDLIDEKEDELAFGEWDRRIELVDEENRCPACTSLGDNNAHVANDYNTKRSFLSTQTSINDECYMVVKKAAFRAMIAEKLNSVADSESISSPTKTPTQTTRSKRLTQLFSLNSSDDAHDEGVLLFGSDDDGYTAVVRTFILKDAKSRGFQRRYMLMALSEDRDMIVWNYKMLINEFSTTARLLQVAANAVYLEEQKFDKNIVIRTAKWLPQQFFKSKIEIDTSRSLEIIVNDSKCYTVLHRDFVGILQRLLSHEKKPLPEKFATQQQASEFSKIFAIEAIRDLKHIQQKLKPSIFQILLWHLCIGGQLICRSNAPVARKQFLFAFTVLLPDDCINFEPCSKTYKFVGEANLLGIPLNAELPKKETDELFIVRLERNLNEKETKSMETFYYNIIVEHLPAKFKHEIPPTIVQRYLSILEEYDKINLRPFLHSIVNEKQECMARTSLIEETCETTKKQAAYFKLHRCPSSDMDVHKFWQQCARKHPKINFDVHRVPEELEEDLKFIEKSFSSATKVTRNGQLASSSTSSHETKFLNGSLVKSRPLSLIR
jgi:hypothetical protein